MLSDAAYFRRRANEQTAAAQTANHPKARLAHLELAFRYERLASAIAEQDRLNGAATEAEAVAN